MIRSNHWKFWLVLFPIIGTCALAQLPGSVQGGFFSQWYGIKSTPSWTPANLTGLLGWWTVTDESTITQVSGTNRVSGWSAKSGSFNFTKTVEAERPSYVTDVVTGQKAIQFSSTQDLDLGTNINSSASNKLYYIVYRKLGTGNDAILIASSVLYDYLQYGNSFYVGGAALSVGINTNGFEMRGAFTGTSGVSVVRYSNAVAQAATSWPSDQGFKHLGGEFGTAANINVRELVYVSGNLTTLDRQKLEGYLAHNSNIQNKLPSDHPYKASPP